MKITATAPTRIDLAGGTLDIYPLYLFENGGLTVNVAINRYSRVVLQSRTDDRVFITATDVNRSVRAENLEALKIGRELDLISRVVKFYRPRCGLTITTHNDLPAGSGLGGSSSLLMALSSALNLLNGTGYNLKQMVDWGCNLEAQSIRIPAGKQDHFAAAYGRVSAIEFGVDGERHRYIDLDDGALGELERRLLLVFTGQSHFSGTNNWAMLKRYIEDRGTTVANLRAIKRTAFKMREALAARDWQRVAAVLNEEWQNRKRLAHGVSTPRIERLMAAARRAGAVASKICGAGGGGCIVTYVEPERRDAVEGIYRRMGAEVLHFSIAKQGLSVQVE